MTIVGVVGDMPQFPYERAPRRTIYVPYQQEPALWMAIGVRTIGDPLRLASAVTAAIHSIDPEQPVIELQTMQKSVHNRAIGLNYMAALMGMLGGIALLLSAVGVYGVMAYLVSEQTLDIGIRMALGAPRRTVLRMIFRRGLLTVGTGLAIGLPLAYLLARLMASLIYGVTAKDTATFVGIPLVLIASTTLAIYLPARRAHEDRSDCGAPLRAGLLLRPDNGVKTGKACEDRCRSWRKAPAAQRRDRGINYQVGTLQFVHNVSSDESLPSGLRAYFNC